MTLDGPATPPPDHPSAANATMEVWLRGPVAGVPPLLMPVAHALIQAAEDLERVATGLTPADLWATPAGVASVGFHLRHVAGSIDRLFTYARGEPLSESQRDRLAAEQPDAPQDAADVLVSTLRRTVGAALEQLRATADGSLGERRGVGRAQVPSTVSGLLFHAAEHAQRHTGQAIVTARVVRGGPR